MADREPPAGGVREHRRSLYHKRWVHSCSGTLFVPELVEGEVAPVAELPVERGALTELDRAALDGLVHRHIEMEFESDLARSASRIGDLGMSTVGLREGPRRGCQAHRLS
jgi:hypothetical protein